jgi:hypothetical protein
MTEPRGHTNVSITTMDSESWIGRTLIDGDDRKLGTIEAIYCDAQTDQPQWMAVKTGLWGSKHSFVPLTDAMPVDDAIRTPYTKSQIDDAPRLAADEDLPDDQVIELYRYYDLAYDLPVDDRLPATAHGTQAEPETIVATEHEPETDAYEVPRTQAEQDMLIATGHEHEVAGYIVPRTQGEQDLLIATGQVAPPRAA